MISKPCRWCVSVHFFLCFFQTNLHSWSQDCLYCSPACRFADVNSAQSYNGTAPSPAIRPTPSRQRSVELFEASRASSPIFEEPVDFKGGLEPARSPDSQPSTLGSPTDLYLPEPYPASPDLSPSAPRSSLLSSRGSYSVSAPIPIRRREAWREDL